jgi:peptidoglycan/xylan/chitin deacetylase (PgdA/CDA1 family)
MSAGAVMRWMRAHARQAIGANRRARRRLDGTCAAVLMYHRVLPRSEAVRDAVEPGMYVTPRTFARHLASIEAHFHALPLHEIVTRLEQHRPLPPGACAITFDDGWRDNHDHALPELERYGIPATLFVVAERVGTQGAFWPDEVCRRMCALPGSERHQLAQRLGATSSRDPIDALLSHLKRVAEAARGELLDRLRAATDSPPPRPRELLDWDELDRLAAAGVDVESHGATHAILTGLANPEIERELRSAREQLRARGHGRHGLVAYPSGGHDDRVKSIASAVGYRAAFTTVPGLAGTTADPMAFPRLAFHDDISRTRAEFLQWVPGRATMPQSRPPPGTPLP